MTSEPPSELAAILAACTDNDQEKVIARRLLAALEPTIELMILKALSRAADQASADIAPNHIAVQLHSGTPQLVVTTHTTPEPTPTKVPPTRDSGTTDDTGTARINLRIPAQLKVAVEAAAAQENLSVNAWASKALANQTQQPTPQSPIRPNKGRLTGWGI